MKKLLLLLTTLLPGICVAQQIDIDWIEVSGNKVIVHYNLEDANSAHQYLINLFSSQDNYSTALAKVTGDVGTEIKPGFDHKIVWDVTKEIPSYKGKLSFEVRGRVFIPYVKLKDFEEGRVYKRGKNVPLNWASGNTGGQVNIELFKGQERIPVENNAPNSGRYDWRIPGNTKKGNDYKLRFTNSKDRTDFVESPAFTIKPKVPLLLKIAGLAAVGFGISQLIDGGKGDPTIDALEGHPGLPTN